MNILTWSGLIGDIHIVHKVTATMPMYRPTKGVLKEGYFRNRRRPYHAIKLENSCSSDLSQACQKWPSSHLEKY